MRVKYSLIYFISVISFLFTSILCAYAVPLPLKNVKVQTRVMLDGNDIYHYFYTVTNPPENEIGINEINIDITLPQYGFASDAPRLEGYTQPDELTPMLALRNGVPYVPVAWKDTTLWKGNIGYEDGRWCLLGNAEVMSWWSKYNFNTKHKNLLNPGSVSEELEVISYGLPGIRKIVFKPIFTKLSLPSDWLSNEDDSQEEIIAKERKIESLGCIGTTIGPSAPPAYNPLQFNQMLQDYVSQSVSLGWLKDSTLTQQLNNYLAQVTTALNENRLADAQNIITQFTNAVQNSNLNQRTNEAYALLYFNAKFFFQKITEEIPVTIEISPSQGEHYLNEEHTTYVKAMQGYVPVEEGYALTARVISGPNTGLEWRGNTDANGNWSFSYKSPYIGTDIIQFVLLLVSATDSDVILWQPSKASESAPIKVTWKGGPDLMLNTFFPPMIKIPFATVTIPLEESTINVGNSLSPASVTRYYMTKNSQMSPTNDIVIGERQVPALAENEISNYKADIPIPADLEAGFYNVYGCADADNRIIELDETNNCKTLVVEVVFPVELSNRPPDCSQAYATSNTLWPPNHKYQSISINGVTDPDGDPVSTVVNYIKQDEPVNGLGDGDTSPDGTISPLQVRAERSGTANGRVYQIGFTAEDGKGGQCSGTVTVCVPHDQGKGKVCIDDGAKYDSTQP